MSLVVPCPGCPTKLSAPESAAGKQIRCPKCKTVVPVPAFIPAEVVAVVEAKAAPAPKPKPVVADDDDEGEDDRPRKKKSRRDEEEDEDGDRPRKKKKRPARDDEDEDDEDEDDRPRKRKRRPARSGGGGRIVVLVLGVLLLVGVCGAGIYFLFGKGGAFAKKAPVPAGWKQYDYPQSGFKAAFPNEPTVFGAKIQGGFGGGALPDGVEIPQIESMYSYNTKGFGANEGTNVSVEIARYSTPIPRASRDMMARDGNNRFPGGKVKRVRWLGGDAAEVDAGGTVMRQVALEKAVITVRVSGPNGTRPKPEEVDGFFDNFELTK